MTDHPIIFSTAMVRAILDGRKTQTRRVIKPQGLICDYDIRDKKYGPWTEDNCGDYHKTIEYCPYGQPGDLLWVRETWHTDTTDLVQARAEHEDVCSPSPIYYKSTHGKENPDAGYIWRPSIHLPKWACQLWLKIIDIRVERLQSITWQDVRAEGIEPGTVFNKDYPDNPYWIENITDSFKELWDSINAKRGYSWESNPWVWVVTFERVER